MSWWSWLRLSWSTRLSLWLKFKCYERLSYENPQNRFRITITRNGTSNLDIIAAFYRDKQSNFPSKWPKSAVSNVKVRWDIPPQSQMTAVCLWPEKNAWNCSSPRYSPRRAAEIRFKIARKPQFMNSIVMSSKFLYIVLSRAKFRLREITQKAISLLFSLLWCQRFFFSASTFFSFSLLPITSFSAFLPFLRLSTPKIVDGNWAAWFMELISGIDRLLH